MKRLTLLPMACLAFSAAGFAAFQAQTPVTPVVTLRGSLRAGANGGVIAAVPGTSRLYFSHRDTLWMYDRTSQRTTQIGRGEMWDLTATADRIAFDRMSEDRSTWHIWSMPLDPGTGLAAGPARRASMSQGDVSSISPDGKLIVFAKDDPSILDGQMVTVVPANGGPERVVARTGYVWNFDWTPDGQSIYASGRRTGGPAIVERVPAAGGSGEFVTQTGINGWLSPDGRLLLTTAGEGQQLRYVVSDPAGKKLGEFTPPARHAILDWSGPTTVLTTRSSTPSAITTVSLAGGRMRRLTDTSGTAIGQAWSPDSRRLAYLQWNGSKLDLVVVNADGTGKRVFAGPEDPATEPTTRGFGWSPDGSRIGIAGGSDSSGAAIMRVLDVATGREQKLNAGQKLVGARWMPDSRGVVTTRYVDSTIAGIRLAVFAVSLDGRERLLREITSNCRNNEPVGDSLIMYGCREGAAIASLRTREAPRLLFPGDTSTGKSLDGAMSPDGRWVIFRVRGANGNPFRAFEVIRVDGSSRHRIELPARALGGFDNPVITHDSRELIFIGSDPASSEQIGVYRVPLAGGEVRKMATLDGATARNTNLDYAISRDGNTIAYVAHGQASTLISEINLAGLLPPAPRR